MWTQYRAEEIPDRSDTRTVSGATSLTRVLIGVLWSRGLPVPVTSQVTCRTGAMTSCRCCSSVVARRTWLVPLLDNRRLETDVLCGFRRLLAFIIRSSRALWFSVISLPHAVSCVTASITHMSPIGYAHHVDMIFSAEARFWSNNFRTEKYFNCSSNHTHTMYTHIYRLQNIAKICR